MNSIKVAIELGMPKERLPPPVQKEKAPEPVKVPVEDKVREALECIDSGHDSTVEWSMINRLYKDLKALKKPNDRAKNLVKMIEPTLSKYGYHKVSDKGK